MESKNNGNDYDKYMNNLSKRYNVIKSKHSEIDSLVEMNKESSQKGLLIDIIKEKLDKMKA